MRYCSSTYTYGSCLANTIRINLRVHNNDKAKVILAFADAGKWHNLRLVLSMEGAS